MSEFAFLVAGILLGSIWAFTSVNTEKLQEVGVKCSTNGGLDKVVFNFWAGQDVYCKDGAKFYLK